MEKEKVLALYGAIGAWLCLGDAESEEIARKIVRELFPPMAKVLVWVGNHSGIYTVQYHDTCPGKRGNFYPRLQSNWADIGPPCTTELEAKAACEAHSQARFLEQLA